VYRPAAAANQSSCATSGLAGARAQAVARCRLTRGCSCSRNSAPLRGSPTNWSIWTSPTTRRRSGAHSETLVPTGSSRPRGSKCTGMRSGTTSSADTGRTGWRNPGSRPPAALTFGPCRGTRSDTVPTRSLKRTWTPRVQMRMTRRLMRQRRWKRARTRCCLSGDRPTGSGPLGDRRGSARLSDPQKDSLTEQDEDGAVRLPASVKVPTRERQLGDLRVGEGAWTYATPLVASDDTLWMEPFASVDPLETDIATTYVQRVDGGVRVVTTGHDKLSKAHRSSMSGEEFKYIDKVAVVGLTVTSSESE
jgi:hypothetical protein